MEDNGDSIDQACPVRDGQTKSLHGRITGNHGQFLQPLGILLPERPEWLLLRINAISFE